MIVSVNWLKKYVDIDIPVQDLVELIGARLVEVESVKKLAPKYKDVIISQVILAQKIEGSDHLSQVLLDDGGVIKNVARNESGYIQVVCGAPNVRAGMNVAWLPPKSVVPNTFDDAEPFVLEARKMLGVMSNGMIASAKELDLYDEHQGILEIASEIEPGSYFSDLFELDDYLLDIENKSLTHRPDTFGVIGFAREIAGILGKPFKSPDWLLDIKSTPKGSLVAPKVFIDNPELAESYELVFVDGNFTTGKTPDEIKSYLSRVGVRPINPVVDATNYMMLISGQPLHAFDYDKLIDLCGGEPEIHVRRARPGETMAALDDRHLLLDEKDIVVTANDHVIALAGAIGGKETAIDENTKSIALESATFNLYNLRSTQMRHGIFSEAITRFTKGQPYMQTGPVLMATLALLDKWTTISGVSEKTVAIGDRTERSPIKFSAKEASQILATELSSDDIKNILETVEFKIDKRGDDLIITAPWWRQDIKIKEDLFEEIGRLRGYDNITPSLPQRSFKAIRPTQFDDFKKLLRDSLYRTGGNETLTYSFVPGSMLDQSGQDKTNAYKIVNSISPELEYYRLSLMPSLLKIARTNLKQGYDEFALFELNKVHAHSRGLTEDAVPIEGYNLACVVYQKDGVSGAEFYQAKYILENLLTQINIKLNYVQLDNDENSLSMFTPYEPKRSAMLKDEKTGELIGVVGEYKKSVAKNFKLPQNIAGFELNLVKLFDIYQNVAKSTYSPISKFPSVERDLCFKVSLETKYQEIIDAIKNFQKQLDENVTMAIEPIDIYAKSDEITKNITIRILLQPQNRTLNNEEINKIINNVVNSVQQKTQATLV